MRRGVLIFTQRVFDLPLVGALKLLHVMLWITAVAFLSTPPPQQLHARQRCAPRVQGHTKSAPPPPPGAGSARQVHLMRLAQADTVFATPNMEIGFLSKRWRAERNLWMSAFAFTSWV